MFDLFRSRDKAVRILLGAILLVVAVSMVTYLIPGSGASGIATDEANVIATVGTDKVTIQNVNAFIASRMQGRNLPPEIMSFYAPQALQQLINQRAMVYEAGQLGIHVSDDDVNSAVRAQLPPSFIDKDGAINQTLLAQALEQQGMSVAQFLEETRKQLLAARLRESVMDGVIVTKADAEREYSSRNEKVKVDYVLIKPAMFEQQVTVTPAEAEAFYQKNRAAYQTPEKKSLALLVIDGAKVQAEIPVTDADLQPVYATSRERFRTPERVKVRHILLKTDAKKNDDAQVQAKAQGILSQLRAKADFGELAKKYSEDTASAVKGGELDFISRGQTVKPFEDAAFSLKPGEISNLVKTMYGYHILQVEEKQDAQIRPFAEVRDTLATEYRASKATQKMQQLDADAAQALKKDPAHPDMAAKKVNADLITASDIKPGDPLPQLGSNPELDSTISALKRGDVSAPITINGNKTVIALVTASTPAHPSALDEVRAQVESSVRKAKLDAILAEKSKQLVDKAKANGGDLAAAAKELGLEVKTSNDFNRNGAVEGLGAANLLTAAFTSKDGSILGPIVAADGRAVVRVVSHTPADMSGFPAQAAALREEMKNKVAQSRQSLFEDGVRKKLEKDGKIKINQDVLNRYTQAVKG